MDPVVRIVRQNVPLSQICLVAIGPTRNDLLGESGIDAGQGNELLARCRIQVDRLCGSGRRPPWALQPLRGNVQRTLKLELNVTQRPGLVGSESNGGHTRETEHQEERGETAEVSGRGQGEMEAV